jgi:hypothetical protein
MASITVRTDDVAVANIEQIVSIHYQRLTGKRQRLYRTLNRILDH